MKTAADPRTDAFIDKSAAFAQPILRHLRRLVHEACPAVEETIKWGMPSFLYSGRILCGMAAFKAHCSFGFWHHGMGEVVGTDGAKAARAFDRITKLDDLPGDAAMLRYLRHAATLNESDVPARPRRVQKPHRTLAVPADLAGALKKFAPRRPRSKISVIPSARTTSSGSPTRSAMPRARPASPPRSSGWRRASRATGNTKIARSLGETLRPRPAAPHLFVMAELACVHSNPTVALPTA